MIATHADDAAERHTVRERSRMFVLPDVDGDVDCFGE